MAADVQIAIIGGGMVGTSLACALAEAGHWQVALVDPVFETPTPQPLEARVVALTRRSEQWLRQRQTWQTLSTAQPYQRMVVWDGEGTGRIELDAASVHQSNLGHIVANSDVVYALSERAQQLPQLTLLRGESLAELHHDGAINHLQLKSGQKLSADLVIGADGANSLVRQSLGIETKRWPYHQRAFVTTIRTQRPHQDTAWQTFLRSGPLAFLPLAEPDHCAIVWSLDEARFEELNELTPAALAEQLSNASEEVLGKVEIVAPVQSFPLVQQHATHYLGPGAVLVGDAAHTIHPLAGQGVNLGFMDVAALYEELIRAHQRGLAVADQSLLRRYQRSRKPDNLAMMAVMEGFKRLFGSGDPALTALRNIGLNQVNRFGWLKQQIIRQAMGLGEETP